MERNVKLYPMFNISFNGFFWGSIFFLYLNERVSLEEVLWLQAIYYIFVVIFEIPSGYFSDHVGRKPTLIFASTSFLISNTIFYFGTQFWQLFIAQAFMAIGFAFYSGTNHSFHYDSLKSLGREGEFGQLEEKANGYAMGFRAICALVGGCSAMYAFKNPYGLSAMTSLVCLIIAFRFQEPPMESKLHEDVIFSGFFKNIKDCLQLLESQQLRWLFIFMIVFTVAIHVPFEFFQSYIDLLDLDLGVSGDSTPLISGIIRAIGTFLGAIFSFYSMRLVKIMGLPTLLSTSVLLEGLIALAMGVVLHPLVVPIIMLRTIPEGLVHAPYTSAVNPLVGRHQRATFFSINSLAGRIAYSLVLVFLSFVSGNQITPDWSTLATMLKIGAIFGVVSFIYLFFKKGIFQPQVKKLNG